MYIEEAINSIRNQTYSGGLEIICVDNNSTDNTFQVLEILQSKFPNIILRKEKKPGANAARNNGLNTASGSWIQFLDADDLLEPQKIEHQRALIRAERKIPAFIAAAYKQLSTDGRFVKNQQLSDNKYLGTFINQAGITSSNLWNKEWLEKVNGWDENLQSSQEADLMMRLMLAGGEYKSDPKALTVIRERESGQISQNDPEKKWSQYLEVRFNYLEKLKQSYPKVYNHLKPQFHDFLMISIITLGRYNANSADHYFQKIRNEGWESAGKFGMGKIKVWFIRYFGVLLFIKFMQAGTNKN